jgi:hypothetical protein
MVSESPPQGEGDAWMSPTSHDFHRPTHLQSGSDGDLHPLETHAFSPPAMDAGEPTVGWHDDLQGASSPVQQEVPNGGWHAASWHPSAIPSLC